MPSAVISVPCPMRVSTYDGFAGSAGRGEGIEIVARAVHAIST